MRIHWGMIKKYHLKRKKETLLEFGSFEDFTKIVKVLPEVALRYPLPFTEQLLASSQP